MRRLTLAVAALLAAPMPSTATAQEIIGEEQARAQIPHFDEMTAAIKRGREMYLYDQAAWHATDRFLADWGQRSTRWLRGYFVEPADGGRLAVVFFGELDGTLVEAARYEVAGSEVVGGGLLDETARPELSPLGRRLVAARAAAFEEAARQEYDLCNRSQPNTLILPPDESGTITVYLMTAPTETDSYPVGGHYRVEVGADDKVASSRRFLNTCFFANYGETADGRPMLLGLTHFLDPQPTEIHVFASYYIPIPLRLLTTENELQWSIEQGRVSYLGSLNDRPDD